MKFFKYFLIISSLCLVGFLVFVKLAQTQPRPIPDVVPGFTQYSLDVDHRDVPLSVSVWYPAEQTQTEPELFGQNALFYGEDVNRNADAITSAVPLILYAHGSGGNTKQAAWFAKSLVEQGFAVAAVNHPNATTQDSLQSEALRFWKRVEDVQALYSSVVSGTKVGLQVDQSKVGLMGFSLGGPTMMALSGIQFSKPAFISYCDAHATLWDCKWLNKGSIDYTTIDVEKYEASYKNNRFSFLIAVEPAWPQAVRKDTLSSVEIPVLLTNFHHQGDIPTAVNSQGLAEVLPNAIFVELSGGDHFSFLSECSLMGKVIIGIASSENICADGDQITRASLHSEFRQTLSLFLDGALAN